MTLHLPFSKEKRKVNRNIRSVIAFKVLYLKTLSSKVGGPYYSSTTSCRHRSVKDQLPVIKSYRNRSGSDSLHRHLQVVFEVALADPMVGSLQDFVSSSFLRKMIESTSSTLNGSLV